METLIAQHLNVSEAEIIKVEEWANVIFVVVKRIGARFVSKKVVKAFQFAQKLAKEIRGIWTSYTGSLQAKIWTKKPGEVRIYVKTWKGKDLGNLVIKPNLYTIDNLDVSSEIQEKVDAVFAELINN